MYNPLDLNVCVYSTNIKKMTVQILAGSMASSERDRVMKN